MMRDATSLLHANGHHMAVAVEPLAEARARILANSYGPVTSFRRLAPGTAAPADPFHCQVRKPGDPE